MSRIVGAICAFIFSISAAAQDSLEGEAFRKNLFEMESRVEKSIEILREQISDNQSAPFLADLYFQLGQLYSQKSSVFYYIQKEKEKAQQSLDARKALVVVNAQQEAIKIYDKILKEFPSFKKTQQVMYSLALSLFAIDEIPRFLTAAKRLIARAPETEDSMRVRLIMGQYYYEKGLLPEAREIITPVINSKFPFERNSAKYRMGLVKLSENDYKASLRYFEEVAVDPELKETMGPNDVSLENRTLKTNLKREALIDSIRAYTYVYPDKPDPVGYYSRVAPNEILFQEIIEKLSVRYVYLKKYDMAIRLLRTYTERVFDPKRVIDVYREVLLSIPLERRIELDVEEMAFVLSKYNQWSSFYEIPRKDRAAAHSFFEKNIRDLSTRNHALAKATKDQRKKRKYLEQARKLYILYIGQYPASAQTVNIAIDLADVLYGLKEYMESGEYYLRVFSGEFGRPKHKSDLIRNAITVLQKPREYSYYENIRVKGLLIQAIQRYFTFDKGKKGNPNLNFLLHKTEYEQGLYEQALANLYDFLRRFPRDVRASDAAHLILDYYNTRADYDGVMKSASRILGMKLPNAKLNTELDSIRRNAGVLLLRAQVEKKSAQFEHQQGQAYLNFADDADSGLQDLALRQALAHAKSENDMDTFFAAANRLAAKEPNISKRSAIKLSLADKYIATGQFNEARTFLRRQIIAQPFSPDVVEKAYLKLVSVTFALRDWNALAKMQTDNLWRRVPGEMRASIHDKAVQYLESPIAIPSAIQLLISAAKLSPEQQLLVYKAQGRISRSLYDQTLAQAKRSCRSSSAAICRWLALPEIDEEMATYKKSLSAAKVSLSALEGQAQRFAKAAGKYHSLENSGDPHLEMLLTFRTKDAYLQFSRYLERAARANKDVAKLLSAKAHEAKRTAKGYAIKCKNILKSTDTLSPVGSYCNTLRVPALRQSLQWPELVPSESYRVTESRDPDLKKIQTQIFANEKNSEYPVELARLYLKKGHTHAALAMATIGETLHRERGPEFASILGCSALRLGLLQEAKFHLDRASKADPLRSGCLANYQKHAGRFK